MDVIDKIEESIKWLESNSKTGNMSTMSIVLDNMSIQCYYFAEQVCDAHDLLLDIENEYKKAKAKFIEDHPSVTKAKEVVENDPNISEIRARLTTAKKLYDRYRSYADRFDKIIDQHKQRVSLVKQLDLKNI